MDCATFDGCQILKILTARNHNFWVPSKTYDVQIESELEPLYDRPFFLTEY